MRRRHLSRDRQEICFCLMLETDLKTMHCIHEQVGCSVHETEGGRKKGNMQTVVGRKRDTNLETVTYCRHFEAYSLTFI